MPDQYYVTITLTEATPQLVFPIGPFTKEIALVWANHYAVQVENQGGEAARTSVNDGEEVCYLIRDKDDYQVAELAVIEKKEDNATNTG